jgi:hypothetical protein
MREPDSRPVVSVNTNMVVVGDRAIGNRDSGGSNRRNAGSGTVDSAGDNYIDGKGNGRRMNSRK